MIRLNRRHFLAASAALGAMTPARAATRPLIIGHRGAAGERPEHTLMGYRLAIAQGADVIEPDLVVTRDGVLVCRHETEITDTTDVASRAQFAGRARDGKWFAQDFTLAEYQSLRAKERIPDLRPGNTAWDGREAPPSFQQVIDLAKSEAARLGRPVGLYPELKQWAELKAAGFETGEMLLAILAKNGLPSAQNPVFIQSFEPDALKSVAGRTAATLVQTTSDPALLSDAGLKTVAGYAQGLGPEKRFVTPHLVAEAHANGLAVHPWTFRAENTFLPEDLRSSDDPAAHGDVITEIRRHIAMGVDGYFTDFPDLGVAARG